MDIENLKRINQLVLKHKLAIEYSQILIAQEGLRHGDIVETSFNLAELMVERISLEADAFSSEKVEKPEHEFDPIQHFMDSIMASIAKQNGRVQ